MSGTVRAHVLVAGSVQGVGFRWYTADRARSMGVAGWVRNLADGRVEAVFEGPGEAVERMVAWCASGPRGASVSEVTVGRDRPAEGLSGFEIRP